VPLSIKTISHYPKPVKENLPFGSSAGRDFNRFSADPPIFVAGQEITLLANFETKKIDIISYAIKKILSLVRRQACLPPTSNL